jgi:hypothetical protein
LMRLCLEDGVFPGLVRIESRPTLQEGLVSSSAVGIFCAHDIHC